LIKTDINNNINKNNNNNNNNNNNIQINDFQDIVKRKTGKPPLIRSDKTNFF
jgi:GH25 family lysozyme M1 (1,4-beta-N-acetylmuramidase)